MDAQDVLGSLEGIVSKDRSLFQEDGVAVFSAHDGGAAIWDREEGESTPGGVLATRRGAW